jgi:hypothetical protein
MNTSRLYRKRLIHGILAVQRLQLLIPHVKRSQLGNLRSAVKFRAGQNDTDCGNRLTFPFWNP